MVKIALWNAMLLIRTPVQALLTVLMVLHLVAAVAGALSSLLDDPQTRSAMSEASVRRAGEFSYDVLASRLQEALS